MKSFYTKENLTATEARANLQIINYLLDSDPHNPELWVKKAINFQVAMVETLPKKIRLETILLWYQQCITDWPSIWIVYYNSALIFTELHHYDKAFDSVLKAIDLNSSHENSWKLLKQLCVRVGIEDSAFENYKNAILKKKKASSEGKNRKENVARLAAEKHFLEKALIKAIYQEDERLIKKLSKDTIRVVHEYADPDLATLQLELDELRDIGLHKQAENLCIKYELLHGPNILTQSYLVGLNTLNTSDHNLLMKLDISPANPLMDIASYPFKFEYQKILDNVFEDEKLRNYITLETIDEFDEQIRWHISHLKNVEFKIGNIKDLFKPLPGQLLQVWNMAVLNFLVSMKLKSLLHISYSATTLAEFYSKLGKSNLPFILYRIAAKNAEQAGQFEYCVNANGKCAFTLMENEKFGDAISHLKKALKYEDYIIAPWNKFELYRTLGECYSELAFFEEAILYYEKASGVKNVPEHLRENVRSCIVGLEILKKKGYETIGIPPILCSGIELKEYKFDVHHGQQVYWATSKHELYDMLLQLCNKNLRIRQSLLERDYAVRYKSEDYQLMDSLIKLAIELEMNYYALIHLESQKSTLLYNRLKHLTLTKPQNIPQQLWQNLQRLVRIYRQAVEQIEDSRKRFEDALPYTNDEVVDAIKLHLWKISKIADNEASKVKQKLVYSDFPEKISCVAPLKTLIVEYFCGYDGGACFLINPNKPQSPDLVLLPEATVNECEKLTQNFFKIIEGWKSSPSLDNYFEFVSKMDKIFYNPISDKLQDSEIERICIIPHRSSHALPLNLMGSSNNGESLGEKFILYFAPSLLTLNSICRTKSSKPQRALVVSNPTAECPDDVCPKLHKRCYALESAEHESSYLTALLEDNHIITKCLNRYEATRSAVLENIASAEIIHFACHGYFNEYKPEYSGLLLSLDKDNFVCNCIFMSHDFTPSEQVDSAFSEILTLKNLWESVDMFECQFLNLSACETARSDWKQKADEFYGLANGFLYTGVQSILSTLWSISDLASEVFNRVYYQELIKNSYAPAISLNSTIKKFRYISIEEIKKMLHSSRNECEYKNTEKELNDLIQFSESDSYYSGVFGHPFFWAGYRIIGNPA